jgi:hypothetical protein
LNFTIQLASLSLAHDNLLASICWFRRSDLLGPTIFLKLLYDSFAAVQQHSHRGNNSCVPPKNRMYLHIDSLHLYYCLLFHTAVKKSIAMVEWEKHPRLQ